MQASRKNETRSACGDERNETEKIERESVHGPKRRGDEDHDQLLVKNEGRGQGSGTGIIEVAQEVGTKVTMAVHVIGSVQENNYYEAAKIDLLELHNYRVSVMKSDFAYGELAVLRITFFVLYF